MREFALTSDRHVFTVAELTSKVKTTLEDEIGRVWVEGEISNLRIQGTSGHAYFTLKDGSAQLSAAMFAAARRNQPVALEDGMVIKAHGDITVYEPRGQYQMIVRAVETDGGIGKLLLALEALKHKLTQEGLFAAERKRELPLLPLHVGLVTSPSGAAIRDILNILERRFSNLRISVAATRVQGSGAAAEIAAAIALLNELPPTERPDVLIVGRGGGSIEDLWAFNEEVAVRAVAGSAIPVISAVGHETDTTLCDYAADLRAPTPSAAAELVVGHKEAFEELLQRQQRTMEQNLMRHIEQLRQRFTAAAQSKSMREPQRLTESRGQVLDNLELRLVHGISAMGHDTRSKLEQARNRMVMAQMRAIPPLYDTLARLKRDLLRSASQLILQQRNKLAVQERSLRALGPQGVLQRGYSLTYTTDGVLVRDASQVTTGMIVKTELAQGSFESTVK